MTVAGVVTARIDADRLAALGFWGLVRCPRCGREGRVNVFAALRGQDPGAPCECGSPVELVREQP